MAGKSSSDRKAKLPSYINLVLRFRFANLYKRRAFKGGWFTYCKTFKITWKAWKGFKKVESNILKVFAIIAEIHIAINSPFRCFYVDAKNFSFCPKFSKNNEISTHFSMWPSGWLSNNIIRKFCTNVGQTRKGILLNCVRVGCKSYYAKCQMILAFFWRFQ